jgi:hypothetical protein
MERTAAVKEVLQQVDSLDVDALSEYFCLILQSNPSAADISSALQLYIGHTASQPQIDEIAGAILQAYTTGVIKNLCVSFPRPDPAVEFPSTSAAVPTGVAGATLGGAASKPVTTASIKHKRVKGKFVKSSSVEVTKEFFSSVVTATGAPSADSTEQPVCRHFLAGVCLRKDCPFLHNTGNVPCRFWTSPSGCQAGDACPFRHDVVLAESADSDDVEDVLWAMREVKQFYDSESGIDDTPDYNVLFPATLPSSNTLVPAEAKATGGPTQAQLIALMSLKSMFPTLSESQIQEGLRHADNDHTTAASWLEKAFAVRQAVPTYMLPSAHSIPSRAHEAEARLVARSLQWVETGATVSSLYAAHRSEAETHAKARNNLLRLATEAYLAGRSAEAARLSKEGRAIDAKMRASHVRAAQSIHTARNAEEPSTLQNIHGRRVCQLDLHGLHGVEAVTVVRDALADISCSKTLSRGDDVWIACLVGTRHHSKRLGKGGGSIHTSLIQFFEDAAWEYYEGAADALRSAADTGGVLLVRIPADC